MCSELAMAILQFFQVIIYEEERRLITMMMVMVMVMMVCLPWPSSSTSM